MPGYTSGVDSPAFYNAGIALLIGVVAQAVAARFSVPSILLLLVAGMLAGPDVTGIFDPSQLGAARTELVQLAVTIILFEGGLGLALHDLRRLQRPLALLLTLGATVSMVAGTVAAHALLGFSWHVASLYGALMIVTGPTVVTPLLARITVDRPLRDLLIGEGVLGDPLGAVVAIVMAEFVISGVHGWTAGGAAVAPWLVGAAVGGGAGWLLVEVLRRRWVPDELRNPMVLGAVLASAALAGRLAPEAGLTAAVVQGIVMGNARLHELEKLRQFKEEMTVIILSFLFVLLAAGLPLSAVRLLGWRGLATTAVVVWVARPVAVFACTVGSGFTTRQKLFLSWICPRGIVAASVAGLFGILLADAGVADGDRLEALVFLTVAATVALQGLTARPLARLLRVDRPVLEGAVLVGADKFGRLLARALEATGRHVLLLDQNATFGARAREEGFAVYQGDALSMDVLEDAGVRYCDTLVAVTTNAELNLLLVERARKHFRITQTLAVSNQEIPVEDRSPDAAFPGSFPGVQKMQHELALGRVHVREYRVTNHGAAGRSLSQLDYGEEEFALVLRHGQRAVVATGRDELRNGDTLICVDTVAPGKEQSPLASLLDVVSEETVCIA